MTEQRFNELSRRRSFGRRWGDNRIPRWTSEAVGLGILLGIFIGYLMGAFWFPLG